jgi:hypothetical protein
VTDTDVTGTSDDLAEGPSGKGDSVGPVAGVVVDESAGSRPATRSMSRTKMGKAKGTPMSPRFREVGAVGVRLR